jgi:hypothetical protein
MRVAIAGAAALTPEGHVMNLGDEAIADTLGAAVAEHASVSRVVTALNVRLAGGAPPPGRFSPRPVAALLRELADAHAVLIGRRAALPAGGTRPASLSVGSRPCVHSATHAVRVCTCWGRDAGSPGCAASRQVLGRTRGVRHCPRRPIRAFGAYPRVAEEARRRRRRDLSRRMAFAPLRRSRPDSGQLAH